MFIDDELAKDIYNNDWFEGWEKKNFPSHARSGTKDMADQELCCTITAIVMAKGISDTQVVKDLLDDPTFINEIKEELTVRKLRHGDY